MPCQEWNSHRPVQETYQIKVILNKVLFESLDRQRALTHPFHKLVVGEVLPYPLDIWTT